MTYTAWGLIIGMVGVAMLFKWGPPQPDSQKMLGSLLSQALCLLTERKSQIWPNQRGAERRVFGQLGVFAGHWPLLLRPARTTHFCQGDKCAQK